MADSQPRRYAERLRAPRDRAREEIGADEGRFLTRQQRARAVREPLRIFERAKLLRRIDEDVAVGADPEAPTRREIIDRRKDAVAEIGRSEGRSGGKECVSTVRSRGAPDI